MDIGSVPATGISFRLLNRIVWLTQITDAVPALNENLHALIKHFVPRTDTIGAVKKQ